MISSRIEELWHTGVVTIGGFRSCILSGLCGVLAGKPYTAARNIGVPFADLEVLEPWASEQARLIAAQSLDAESQVACAEIIRALGGSTKPLKIAECASGWMNAAEISELCPDGEVLLLQDAAFSLERDRGELSLNNNVYCVSMGVTGILQTGLDSPSVAWPLTTRWKSKNRGLNMSLEGAVVEAIAHAWVIPLPEILKASQWSTDEKSIKREIGTRGGNPVVKTVDVLRRPKAS